MTDRKTIQLTPTKPDKELRATLYDWGSLNLTSIGPKGGYTSVSVPATSVPRLAQLINPEQLDNRRQGEDQPIPFDVDREGMNDERADWARDALETFQERTGTDDCDAIGDLIADLAHLCDREGERFGWSVRAKIERGLRAYEQEAADAEPEEIDAAEVVGAI
jgi:hypothetical protein